MNFNKTLKVLEICAYISILATLLISNLHTLSPQKPGLAIVIKIDGVLATIDKPLEEYVKYALSSATERNVPLIVVVNSYGGYLDSTVNIGDMFLNSRVPIVGFIDDKAFSAASIVVQSMHIVAITSTGVIGAAQPVQVNPVTGQYEFINESKVVNSVVALATRYAEARGRNVTAVEMFIRRNLVLNSAEALKNRVVDIIANSLDELIEKVNGSVVTLTPYGQRYNITLNIRGYEYLEPPFYVYVYSYLRDPTVNSILWFIGFFGTFILLLSGNIHLMPFTVVFLILALLGGGVSVNVVSILLIALGSILLAVEFVVPGFGILGVSGVVALVLGFLLMPITSSPYLYPNVFEAFRTIALIVGGGLGTVFSFILYKVMESRRKRRASSIEMLEQYGKVVERIEPGKRGLVLVGGEYWYAESDETIEPGEEVVVVGRNGLTLRVKRRYRRS